MFVTLKNLDGVLVESEILNSSVIVTKAVLSPGRACVEA